MRSKERHVYMGMWMSPEKFGLHIFPAGPDTLPSAEFSAMVMEDAGMDGWPPPPVAVLHVPDGVSAWQALLLGCALAQIHPDGVRAVDLDGAQTPTISVRAPGHESTILSVKDAKAFVLELMEKGVVPEVSGAPDALVNAFSGIAATGAMPLVVCEGPKKVAQIYKGVATPW